MPRLREIEENLVRVTGLQLKSFRGFRFMDLQLEQAKPVNVLIADNGGGKTTILDAVAGFLLDFLNQTILHEDKVSDGNTSQSWKSKDVKNGDAVAYCKATLALTYWHPPVELLEVISEITEFLNEYELEGQLAWLSLKKLGGDVWDIILDDNEDEDDKPDLLPNEITNKLDKLSFVSSEKINTTKEDIDNPTIQKLSPDDRFIVARKTPEGWKGNTSFEGESQKISKVKYSGLLDLEVEINRTGAPVFGRPVLSRSNDLNTHISHLRNGVAFLEDFRRSVQDYNSENTHTTLPILVYYGGSAISTKFGEVGIRYIEQPYQAYKNALQPNRFDFEDFFEWLNWIKSNEPKQVFNRVKETILSALNADESTYRFIRIEQGQLRLDKVYQEDGSSQPVEVSQLSAGEKNLFALVGDLVKRALQLNPVLFEIDFDENVGTFSNPLEYTQGVVLIDELDLHLHPKWQRQIMPTLQRLFPKVQFLVTTHSPFIVQEVDGSMYRLKNNTSIKGEFYGGWSIAEILTGVMGVSDGYGSSYESLVDSFFEELEKGDINAAEKLLSKIVPHLKENSPFKAKLINRLEILKEDWL